LGTARHALNARTFGSDIERPGDFILLIGSKQISFGYDKKDFGLGMTKRDARQ
jgi:hypothetical protein